MFLGSFYTRHDIAFAYAWYDMLWSPTRYAARLHRMRVRLGACASFETEDNSVKEVYGAIVRREHALYVGFSRLQRRAGERLWLSWPGSSNMPGGERAWLRSVGLLAAVESMVES